MPSGRAPGHPNRTTQPPHADPPAGTTGYTFAHEGRHLAAQVDDPVTQALDDLAEETAPTAGAASGRALIDGGLWEW